MCYTFAAIAGQAGDTALGAAVRRARRRGLGQLKYWRVNETKPVGEGFWLVVHLIIAGLPEPVKLLIARLQVSVLWYPERRAERWI